MNGRAILLKPVINEKSMQLVKSGLYTFAVDKDATKEAIARIVAGKFKVEVISVKTLNIPGKVKSQRQKRGYYRLPDTKKAIIKVKSGQRIPIFESVESEEVEVKTAESKAETKEKRSLVSGTKVKIEKTPVTEAEHKEKPRKGAKQAGKKKGESK